MILMKSLHKIRIDLRRQSAVFSDQSWSQSRTLFDGIFGRKKAKTESEDQLAIRAAQEFTSDEPELDEEEVKRMRDVSRLPPLVRAQLTGQNIPEIRQVFEMKTENIRKRYAMYGQASGLKPGVQWPTRMELEWLKGYEKAFCKPLHQMTAEVRVEKAREAEVKRLREKDVLEKLKQLPKLKKEFWAKYRQMHASVDEERAKKERLVQDVREFVGYDLDPKDPRFEEVLAKRDEELKKVQKAAKKQERQRQHLEKLQALANEALEWEKEGQEMLDKSKTETNTGAKSGAAVANDDIDQKTKK